MLLQSGSRGSEVAAAQFAINSTLKPPTPLKVDGIFGPKTLAMTKDYQQRRGLKPDGLVGPLTLDSLFQIVTMTATVRMRAKEGSDSKHRDSFAATPRAAFGQSGQLSNRPPPPPWESPWMAEMRNSHAAFLKWMSQPAPKFALPVPPMFPPPTVVPLGTLNVPPPFNQIPVNLPGPPTASSYARLPAPLSGADYAIQIGGASTFDISGRKHKETELKVSIDWGQIRGGKLAEVGLETAVIVNHEGKFSTEVEGSISGGKSLKVFAEAGPLSVKVVPYITTAISSELSANLFVGAKGVVRAEVIKDFLFLELVAKTGPKVMLQLGETEAGNPFLNVKVVPLVGVGELVVGVRFQ